MPRSNPAGFVSMAPLLPPAVKGRASIQHWVPEPLSLLRAKIKGYNLTEGRTYCQLWINGDLWMSDTHDEMAANSITASAYGDVLILGLGIGMVLHRVLQNQSVKSVDVLERDRDVSRLVWPHVGISPRAHLIIGDALKWTPKRRYDFIWLDIWLNTPDEDELRPLLKRYRRFLRRGGFIGAWEGN